MASGEFRTAIEAHRAGEEEGLARVEATLAPDVVFNSPAVFKPYEGRDAVMTVLRAAFEVFEDFRYEDELAAEDKHALIFSARVGDRRLQGLDLLRLDDRGKVAELTVMVRPMSGLTTLAEAMKARLEAA